jgi:hypothetical protein
MTTRLSTRNVFIDTSIFVSENFNVQGTKFDSLASLAREERVFIKSSDITFREIICNLEESVETAAKIIQKTKTEARILRNLGSKSSYQAIFAEFPTAKIVARLTKQIRGYFKISKTEILPALKISPSIVFDKYFTKKPPFGFGKKKAEFPDAFVLSALEQWCDKTQQQIYVISQDPDMTSACSGSVKLIHLPSLQVLLELVIAHHDKLAELVHERFQRNAERIRELISEELKESIIGLADEDGEGEVTSVLEVSFGEVSIIKMTDDVATLEFQANITFTADIWFDDLATASYDSEEGRLIPWQQIEREVERELVLPVELSFEFSKDNKEYFLLHHIMINSGEPFRIWVDEDAKTFYK